MLYCASIEFKRATQLTFTQTDIEELIHAAKNEVLIEHTLNELINKWNQLTFTFRPHHRRTAPQSFTIECTHDLMQIIEDDSIRLQKLSSSP